MKEVTINTEQSREPRLVAEHILWLRRDLDTTPMHVLKLVYFCHGWVLGLTDQALINEPVEAWTYGPVVPSIYRRYKSFGGDAITAVPQEASIALNERQRTFVEVVEDVYRNYSALELSALTHYADTPWDQTRRKYGLGAIIPNELIRTYYRERLADVRPPSTWLTSSVSS